MKLYKVKFNRFNFLFMTSTVVGILFGFAGCSGGKTAGSSSNNQNCPSGEVKVLGVCHKVCAQISECAFTEVCNPDGVCLAPADGKLPPRLTAIDGDGTADGAIDSTGAHSANHIGLGLQVSGANLDGATVALQGLDGEQSTYGSDLFTLRDGATASQFSFDLPRELVEGKYLLTVSNQSGSAEATLVILQGEKGVDGVAGEQGVAGATGEQGLAGSININGSAMQVLFINNDGNGGLQADGSEIYYDSTTGNVAVGAAATDAKFAIVGGIDTPLVGTNCKVDVTVSVGLNILTFPAASTGCTDEFSVGDALSIGGIAFLVTAVEATAKQITLNSDTVEGLSLTVYKDGTLLKVTDGANGNRMSVDQSGNLSVGGNITSPKWKVTKLLTQAQSDGTWNVTIGANTKFFPARNGDSTLVSSPAYAGFTNGTAQNGSIASNTFTTSGGTAMFTIFAAAYGDYRPSLEFLVDDQVKGRMFGYSGPNNHTTMGTTIIVNLPAGSHTFGFKTGPGTSIDHNDFFDVTLMELPF